MGVWGVVGVCMPRGVGGLVCGVLGVGRFRGGSVGPLWGVEGCVRGVGVLGVVEDGVVGCVRGVGALGVVV